MEIAEERDSEMYANQLAQMLIMKDEAVYALRNELNRFRSYRSKTVVHLK